MIRSMGKLVIALLLLPRLITPAPAQTLPIPGNPVPSNATVLHLTEAAQRNVPRDRLHAELAAEVTDPNAAKVQAEINRRMSAALVRVKAVPEIAVETTGYSVYQERPDKATSRWHGSQTIALTAKDFASLLALVGALQQDGLVVTGLAPELSREARQAVEDELTDVALARLQKRAERIAATLGTKLETYRDLRVGNAGAPSPTPRAMNFASAVSSAPLPVAEAGEALVTVSVQADIVLAPRP